MGRAYLNTLHIFWNTCEMNAFILKYVSFPMRGKSSSLTQCHGFFCHTKLFKFSSTDNTTSHYLARVMYVMETFQLSWYLIQIIDINANGIARNITYSRGSRSVFANCLIIWNETSDVRNPFRHARGWMENSILGVSNTCYTIYIFTHILTHMRKLNLKWSSLITRTIWDSILV